MFINYSLLPYILMGIALIALLDTFGAIVSRKLNFNYGLLSPVSFGIYTLIAYLTSRNNSLDVVLACNILIGMFDAIIGWNVSMRLKANVEGEGQLIEITEPQRTLAMAAIGSVFAVIGYMMVHNITL